MSQKKLPFINSAHGSDTRNIINEIIKMLNNLGYTYEESLKKAQEILDEAKRTSDENTSTNERIDNIIGELTEDAEIVDARKNVRGQPFTVLKKRLDHAEKQQQVTPHADVYDHRIDHYRRVLLHDGDDNIYTSFSRTGSNSILEKSKLDGSDRITLGEAPFAPHVLYKIHQTGTLILIENSSHTVSSPTRVMRSVDDGVSWEQVTNALRFPPISSQGVSETPEGNIVVGEYGNVANTSYRIFLSKDDGRTWEVVLSSPGTDPGGDPGHIHSVVWDDYEKTLVAFMDRPHNQNYGIRIYRSDNGENWDLIGVSDNAEKPNYVSPMFFLDYIAWGSDNERNGVFSRIKREDFYRGDFEKSEDILKLNDKALYFTFPIRQGVWMVSMATEVVGSSSVNTDVDGGTYSNEIFIVSDNGGTISGGFKSVYTQVDLFKQGGFKNNFPSYKYDRLDHGGTSWVNALISQNYPGYSAVPYAVGMGLPTEKITQDITNERLHYQAPLRSTDSTGDGHVNLISAGQNDSIIIKNNKANAYQSAEIRMHKNGDARIMYGSNSYATITDIGIIMEKLIFASNGIGVFVGSGSPEGNLSAHPGSIYLNWHGGISGSIWTKISGTGNTGWQMVGAYNAPTTGRPTSPARGTMIFDNTLNRPIWYNGTRWINAMGEEV